MKTIAKAITNNSARDGFGQTYYSEDKLIRGECYLVDNGVLKHMLMDQSVICFNTPRYPEFHDDDIKELYTIHNQKCLDKLLGL